MQECEWSATPPLTRYPPSYPCLLVVWRRRTPLLLLLSEARAAAVYTTADLVLQGRECDAERVVTDDAAIAEVSIEQTSSRAIAVVATPYKPRARRIYKTGTLIIPLTTIISFIESLATTGLVGTRIEISEVIIVNIWWMSS